MQLCFPVPACAEGVPLRQFLRSCAVSTELTRAVKYRGSGFFLDDLPVHTNVPVHAGQMLSFALPPEETPPTRPQPELPLRIVHADALAVVIEKPAGIAVHPTRNYPDGTLANAWSAWAQANGESGVFRPVNRLDKNTSGLLLAARSAWAAPVLAGHVQKTYLAVAEGEMPPGPGVFDGPIGPKGDSIIGRCVRPDGKPSRTEYTVLRAADGLSLAACRPVTGRTHQIRVHFSAAGHPLAGDDLYGGHIGRIGRHALHCAAMRFERPAFRQENDRIVFHMPLVWEACSVESPLPDDMKSL